MEAVKDEGSGPHTILSLHDEVKALRALVTPKEIDWSKWLPIGLGALTSLIILIAWLLGTLGNKAAAADVKENAQRTYDHALRLQAIEQDQIWIKGTLWEMAKKQGVFVLPPPVTIPSHP